MQQPTFEAALARLEEIVRLLERGEASLEQSLALFEEGSRLARICQERLSAAEQQVTALTAEGEVPFSAEA